VFYYSANIQNPPSKKELNLIAAKAMEICLPSEFRFLSEEELQAIKV